MLDLGKCTRLVVDRSDDDSDCATHLWRSLIPVGLIESYVLFIGHCCKRDFPGVW